jgi:transposase
MIGPEVEAEIVRLFHAEHWRVGTIATELGVHHTTVRRVLAQAGIELAAPGLRPSIADPFVPFIVETLRKHPRLRATRLYQMVKSRGYPGGPDHFRVVVARYRPRKSAQAYLRLRTLPGEQAQVDWGHFGKLGLGRATRALMGFVMVLSYSRQIFLEFFLGQAMANFLRGHVDAFDFFTGVPRTLLYDNLKSAVLERRGDAIRFHPTLLELAAHYRYAPRPVAPARGNEKGRVERAIRFVRDSFFAARTWKDLDDLNRQALAWSLTTAAERACPGERSRTVAEVFAEERGLLLPLPDNPFPTHERTEAHVGKTPYVRFDLNDYSVPHTHVRQTLVVLADRKSVRILDGNELVATHTRSFDRGTQIEDPAHIQALVDHKRTARRDRGIDRLHHAVPTSQRFFVELASRGGNLGAATTALVGLLDRYGAQALERAVAHAVSGGLIYLGAVRQLLDEYRQSQGQPVPVARPVATDPRIRDLVIRPHALESYDRLEPRHDDSNDEKS